MSAPWQCPICGTVYAWWVAKCREKHPVQPAPRTVWRWRHCGCADMPCSCMRSGGSMTTTIGSTT